MRRHLKALTLAGAALAVSLTGLGASAGVAAADIAPTLGCSNSPSVCNPGAGDVGVAYATDIFGYDDNSNSNFTISFASGNLPSGLQFSPRDQGSGDTGGQITGTPTAAGTYDFTLQITDTAGTSSTQPYSITVGTGTADNLDITSAVAEFYPGKGYDVAVNGEDPNVGATYTVYVTSTGQKLATMTDDAGFVVGGTFLNAAPQNVTVKDSLGSSVTVPVGVSTVHKY